MSLIYCQTCDREVDTDIEVEHLEFHEPDGQPSWQDAQLEWYMEEHPSSAETYYEAGLSE